MEWGILKASDTIKKAADNAGYSLRGVSQALGKSPNYIASSVGRGSNMQADTLAGALAVCGYALAAVPFDSVPPDALVIDAPGEDA